jgi:hypothetical protein
MSHSIFLSYSRDDTGHMQRIRRDLQDEGFGVWTDENIKVGTPNWKREVEKAIRKAKCLICVLTPRVPASDWVRAELDFAQELGKKIYFVHISGKRKQVTILGFATHQALDVRDDALYSSQIQDLCKTIEAEFGIRRTPRTYIAHASSSAKDLPPVAIPDFETHSLNLLRNTSTRLHTKLMLDRPEYSIGRGADNSFSLDDGHVSRHHCRLVYTQEGFFLFDEESTNGTYVNGKRITAHRLQDGDEIRIGETVMVYHVVRTR